MAQPMAGSWAARLLGEWLTFAAFLLFSVSLAVAQAQRPFTVNDLLNLEDIGDVAFSPQGDRVVFERLRPYDQAPTFGYELLGGKERAQLFVAEIDDPRSLRLLFAQKSERGYWLGPFSPDGAYLVVFWIEDGTVGAGIYDFVNGDLRELPITPELFFHGQSPQWISAHELLFVAVRDGTMPVKATSLRTDVEHLPALWAAAGRGQTATATVLTSGQGAGRTEDAAPHALLRVNARNGKIHPLDHGHFAAPVMAPDHRHVAILRSRQGPAGNVDLLRFPADPLRASDYADLVLYSLDGNRQLPLRQAGYHPILGTLTWSSDGERLAFLVRDEGAHTGVQAHGLVTLSLPSGRIAHYPLKGLAVDLRHSAVAWLRHQPVLYAKAEQDGSWSKRADWHLMQSDGKTVNLTAGFSSVSPELAAIEADAMVVLADGGLWRVFKDGYAVPLVTGLEPVQGIWRSPHEPVGQPSLTPVVVFGGQSEEVQEIAFFDLTIATAGPVGKLRHGDRLLAVAEKTQAIVVRAVTPAGDVLELMQPGQERVALWSFNTHLKNIQSGQVVPISYRLRGDVKTMLQAWLLLPAQYGRAQKPPPLIVNIYPGKMFAGPWPWSLSSVRPFNPHLWAAAGYAVLYPSLPLMPQGQGNEPLLGLAEKVMPAVDRVIELGYGDADRLGVFGHSYGGYGVLGLLAECDRFKAAVVSAAPVNLTSHYGQFDARLRFLKGPVQVSSAVRWAEISQGRMGAPPWADLARYVRNSPLFYADRIQTPVMLVQGDRDFISLGQGEEMFTALYRLGKDVTFVRYWGEGHGLASPANIRDFWARMLTWYGRYLGEE